MLIGAVRLYYQDLFPLLYLLLLHDCRLIKLAQTNILSDSEFTEAFSTLDHVTQAARVRVAELEGAFHMFFNVSILMMVTI